ncbi:MAG: winged helix-turn-helix transcriptional regulator [Xanthomonadales bacterium]|nr:winged helix-turn-helix transcriptional regulator [Xanthomonadales bacterium]
MDTFTALADPTRRRIIERLALGETAFGTLAAQFEMSRPAVSQHLKALREAGIVTARADAQRRIYRLTDDGLEELDAWLRKVQGYWNERLDRLERLLAEDDTDKETNHE